MAQSNIFYLPELLEQILFFLVIDKSLYPTLYVFHASSQDGLVFKAEYYRNKIDNRIIDFITQIGESKKGMVKPWISCDITPSDNYGKSGRFA